MGIRYSFDLGTNSIGWAVWRFGDGPYGANTPLALLGAGVRIFRDGRNPKDQQSLAVMRRVPRAQRRRRDRFLLRRRDLMAALAAAGLWPTDDTTAKSLAGLNPYQLRAEGLERALAPYELGRALFHLNQRRGFKSNRKADRKNKDDGKIAEGAKRLRERLALENARTLGEFLWRRQNKADVAARLPARIRLQGVGAKALYEFYPTREMVEDEFRQIWKAQAGFAPDFVTADKRDTIHRVLFRQRPLKPPKIGYCTLVEGEQRLPKALPSVEARVIYETLNHIEVGAKARKLDLGERNALASVLLGGKNMTMAQIRKALKLPADQKINFEEGGRDKLEGAKSAWILGEKGPIGKSWAAWPLDRKDAFVRLLLTEADEFALVDALKRDFGLTEEQAAHTASIVPEEGYARLGPTANAALLAELMADVVTYDKAVVRAGQKRGEDWHHSDERDGEILKPLPYYPEVLGRHVIPGDGASEDVFLRLGRIANPTVHICLNQLRRIVNELVAAYEQPDEIVLELARDLKNSLERRKEIEADNRRNREAAEKRTQRLIELGQPDTGENRARLRMFEEQERAGAGVARCPYTLRSIGLTDLFSSEIDIDHILPMSRTLDDGRANRLLCWREANRVKRNQTPFEAFGRGWTTAKGERVEWDAIAANAATLPTGARWRFLADAMERFNADGRDFLARQLNETRYLSRLAKAYLSKSCNPDNVWVVTGQMIGLLRGKWGLNDLFLDHNRADLSPEAEEKARKDRNDHRHHAIDAIVIGAMTRGLVNEIARRAGQAVERDERLFAGLEPPFPEFRQAARTALENMIVSHKPEHRTTAALHEDTAYGFVRNEKEASEIGNLVRRKAIDTLTGPDVDAVRDPVLRSELQAIRAPFAKIDEKAKGARGKRKVKLTDEKGFQQALKAFGEARYVRRIRVGKVDQSAVAIADHRDGEMYKALVPGENHHVDIVQMRDGSWQGFAATYFEVNQKGWRPRWEADRIGGKLVMRLHKNDLIEIADKDDVRRVKVVVRLAPSQNRLYLLHHTDAGKREYDKTDAHRWDLASISKLKERGAIAVRVDEIGRVKGRKSNIA